MQARGERWHVRDARHLARVRSSSLMQRRRRTHSAASTLLLPFDRLDPASDGPPARRRRQAVVRGALHALSQARPQRVLWTAPGARVDLLPWQLAPALAVLGGVNRLLLADAVGLGKTIQAGLVLAELRARGLVERALILAPAALRGAWAVELTTRFDLPVDGPRSAGDPGPRTNGRGRREPMEPDPGDRVVARSRQARRGPAWRSNACRWICSSSTRRITPRPGTDRHAAVSRLARQVPVGGAGLGHAAQRRRGGVSRAAGAGRRGIAARRSLARVPAVARRRALRGRPPHPHPAGHGLRRGTAAACRGAGLRARALPIAGGATRGRAAAGGRARPARHVLAHGGRSGPCCGGSRA